MAYRYGLSIDVFNKIIDVFAKYSLCIEKAIIFGSRARGDYKKTSDIDIALKFKLKADNDKIYQIKDELSQENIIYTFDIIDYHKISNNELKEIIDHEGQVIFSTDKKGEIVMDISNIKIKINDLEKTLSKLHESLARDYRKDDIVIDANIQRFEFVYEMSWKLMKAYLEYNGNLEGSSPRNAIRESFKIGLIDDGDGWLAMLQDRNLTSHTYDERTALAILENISNRYVMLFDKFLEKIKEWIRKDD